nr:YccF domain-containing protein [Corynebacterium lactis]
MRLLLNIIWLLFGGLWLALGYVFFGVIACLLIVTIPAGVASFRMASYALWPFGRTVVERSRPGSAGAAGAAVMNVVWFLVAGLWLALGHITTAAAQAVTIVGLPLAVANVKMIPVTCFPFGKEIVSSDRAGAYAEGYTVRL